MQQRWMLDSECMVTKPNNANQVWFSGMRSTTGEGVQNQGATSNEVFETGCWDSRLLVMGRGNQRDPGRTTPYIAPSIQTCFSSFKGPSQKNQNSG